MTYYVIKIRHDNDKDKRVTDVMVGPNLDGSNAKQVTTSDAVKRINDDKEEWYTAPNGRKGARVHAHDATSSKKAYLHTDGNSKKEDDLESLPKF